MDDLELAIVISREEANISEIVSALGLSLREVHEQQEALCRHTGRASAPRGDGGTHDDRAPEAEISATASAFGLSVREVHEQQGALCRHNDRATEAGVSSAASALGLSPREVHEQQEAMRSFEHMAVSSKDLRISSRSSEYVAEVGGNENIRKSPGGYFYKRASPEDAWVRVGEAEYTALRKEGGHLVDCGIAAKLLEKIPGPRLRGDRLAALKDVLNEGGTNLRSKTRYGNRVRDKVPEGDFNKLLDGDLGDDDLWSRWTPDHKAKLGQYRRFLDNTEGDDRVPAPLRKRLQALVGRLEAVDRLHATSGKPRASTPPPQRRSPTPPSPPTPRASTRAHARDTGLRFDRALDMRTTLGRCLVAPPPPPQRLPARETGLRLDGSFDMRTSIGVLGSSVLMSGSGVGGGCGGGGGPRCADGSLDMRFASNRGRSKWG